MTCSSSLADDLTTLVLDTSVLINLHACTFGERILAVIPNTIVVSDIVVRELEHETSRANGESQFILGLIKNGIANVVQLDDRGYQIYETLIRGPGSLDDGEAATIAAASTLGFIPVIDERKGRARVKTLMNGKIAAWSLDLLVHQCVQKELRNGGYVEAVYLALREGRMRIDEERCDAVVNLIGVERAMNCACLPGYKLLLKSWEQEQL